MFLKDKEQVFLRGQRLQMKKNALFKRSYHRCLDVLAQGEIGADIGSELMLRRALEVSRTVVRVVQARLNGEGLTGRLIGRLIGSVSTNRLFNNSRGAMSLISHYHHQWNKRDEKACNLVAVHEHLAFIAGSQSQDSGRAHGACQDHLKTARHTLLVSLGMAKNH